MLSKVSGFGSQPRRPSAADSVMTVLNDEGRSLSYKYVTNVIKEYSAKATTPLNKFENNP